MAEVRLRPMTGAEYGRWYDWVVEDYAASYTASGEWDPGDAAQMARQAFAKLLPDGPDTAGQHLYTVVDAESAGALGVIWFAERRETGVPQAYIYDVTIWPEHRRRGYAAAALLAVEAEARAIGLERIALHVFSHNDTAVRLYERTGYRTTNQIMAKDLD